MKNLPAAGLSELLQRQRAAFAEEMNSTVAVRKDRLDRLAAMGEKHASQIVEAISADFGHRSPHETRMAELLIVGTGIRDQVLSQTISDRVTLNDCIWHIAQEDQPFGGVGASGTGCYHGKWGFRTFSKEKPVFSQSRLNGMFLMYPPYGKTVERMLALLKRLA